MKEILSDNIYVVFGDPIFQQSIGMLMGAKCAPWNHNGELIFQWENVFENIFLKDTKAMISHTDM